MLFRSYVYTFRAGCLEEPECCLEDGAVRIFLNTRGKNDGEVSKELVGFLRYVEDTTDEMAADMDSERIKRIHNRVRKVKASEEVGVKYMQAWEEKLLERQKEKREALYSEHLRCTVDANHIRCIKHRLRSTLKMW